MRRLYTLAVALIATLSLFAQRDGDKITINTRDGKQTVYNLTGTTDALSKLTFNNEKMGVVLKGLEDFGAWEEFGIDNLSSVMFSVYKESDVSGVTLADPSATDQARRLYRYLKSVYGVKTLSSVMADVNWNNDIAENILKKTGKAPAFNCYDFIHIYVPDGNGWINYSDTKPVTDWAGAGGLVQLMWHFNVPKSETTKIENNGAGVTCTPSETTFSAKNALMEGTWENRWMTEQMDRVCDVLLKLQQAGIAAVWRPFHEAAGNATLKSGAAWGKSWFWWGYDGPETYCKLWKQMWDHFQQRGVHNLIWVWTTQNCNGDATQYDVDTAWYPGDAYVDIIGRDLYDNTAAQAKQEFDEIQARYPGKLVALAECGKGDKGGMDKISDIWNAGAKWSWFMAWYGSSLPADDWWADAMSCENVITRDQVDVNSPYIEESAASAVKNMGLGFNLGNTLDASGDWMENHRTDTKYYETAWGQPVATQSQFDFLKREGFNAVRVPVTWFNHIDDEGNIDEAWMNRVAEVVDYAMNAGLYCILNVHHDTGSGTEAAQWLKADMDVYGRCSARYKNIWRQIAARFSGYSNRLVFEGYNEMLDAQNTWTEPKLSQSFTAVNSYAQDFVNTVRETGGNNLTRNLIVTTYSAAHTQKAIDSFTVPADKVKNHLIVEVHSYDPWNWINTYGEWNSTCQKTISDMFDRLNKRFVSQGIPCIIGEYGTNGQDEDHVSGSSSEKLMKAAADYSADMVSKAKALNIATFYWMSIFDAKDREKPQWSMPSVVDAMKAAWRK